MTDDTKPELDPAYRESLEGAHYGSQMHRWARAGRKLSERRRAEPQRRTRQVEQAAAGS